MREKRRCWSGVPVNSDSSHFKVYVGINVCGATLSMLPERPFPFKHSTVR